MAAQRTVPFSDGMELGLGVDDLTGQVGSLAAVQFSAVSSAVGDTGMVARYDTNLVNSAEQMYDSVGVSVQAEGRYGLFSAEGKFSFMEESRFSSTSTFLVARADIQSAFLRATESVPVADAQALVRDGKKELFRKRYGDMFIRGVKTGGEFIAIISVTASLKETEQKVAANLKASFDGIVAGGSVSTDVETKNRELREKSTVRVTIYQRGGTGDQIAYVGTVEDVQARLKTFASSVKESPKAYSVQTASYDTLVFPDEPNWFEIRKAQEVLEDCLKQRLRLTTARNDVEAVIVNPDFFLDPPNNTVLSAWSTELTNTLNELDAHISSVIDSISDATFLPLRLPDGFKVPERIEHSSQMVEVFTHSEYADEWQGIPGSKQKLTVGRYDNAGNEILVGNDQISSTNVPEGLGVRCYEHAWFQGNFIDFTQDTPRLPKEWNDAISALVVYPLAEGPPRIEHVVALDFTWVRPLLLTVGQYPDLAQTGLGAATLGALLVPRGLSVRVWDGVDFTGESAEFFADITDLGPWNDRARSLQVSPA